MDITPENKSTQTDLPEKNLRLLLDTIECINQTNELKSVLIESMESVRLVMSSEASSLILMDEDKGELFVSMPTGPVKQDVVGKRIPKDKGISGWVYENRRPYLTNDVTTSEHFYGDIAEGFTTRNMICVPLINRENRAIGVLQAINRRGNEDFTPHNVPVFQALASHVTIAIERARRIDNLHESLKEKDTMLQQVHQQVKESLQILSDQIESEIVDVKDQKAKEVLQNVTMRIDSMWRLHNLLSEKNLSNSVDLGEYLGQLSGKIEETMSSLLTGVTIELNTDSVQLPKEKALLCGLILNELMINLYKHAFVAGDSAKIDIELVNEGDKIKVVVSDREIGLPEDFNFEKEYSIGMWIVDDLLKKLNGSIQSAPGSGTRFTLSLNSDSNTE